MILCSTSTTRHNDTTLMTFEQKSYRSIDYETIKTTLSLLVICPIETSDDCLGLWFFEFLKLFYLPFEVPIDKHVFFGTYFYIDFDKVDCTWNSDKN